MKKRFFVLILFLSVAGAKAQTLMPASGKLSLLFMGDIMGHDEQIWSAENRETGEYNYDDVFRYIRPYIDDADIAVGNLEVTLGGPPYKGYPAFSSPAALAAACKNAGIDCLVTANNHSADRGKKGILSTIARLDSLGIPHTGTFADTAARESLTPLILEKNGFRLALLNYTYGTNGIKVPGPVVVNMLDREQAASDIAKARSMDPDLLILFLHWGNEYDTVPRREQLEMASFFFDKGVDFIIGSHPHVIQKMDWVKRSNLSKDRLTAYSLGNFVSNQRKPKTDGGTMIRIEVERKGDTVLVSDASYILTWVYTPIEKYRKKFFILPCAAFEDKAAFFADASDYRKMKFFISESRRLLNPQNVNIAEYRQSALKFPINY